MTGRARAEGREHILVVDGGQRDYPNLGLFGPQPSGRRDPVEHGHARIHQEDVRSQCGGSPHGLVALAGLAHHLDLLAARRLPVNPAEADGGQDRASAPRTTAATGSASSLVRTGESGTHRRSAPPSPGSPVC